jgi:hypothetical protein
MKICWWYEPKLFTLLDGSWYRPDFCLGAGMRLWAEVKPTAFTHVEFDKAYQISRPIVLLVGLPNDCKYRLIHGEDSFIELRTSSSTQMDVIVACDAAETARF